MIVEMVVTLLMVGRPQAGTPDDLVGAEEDPRGPVYPPDEILDEIGDMFGDGVEDEIRNSGVGWVEVDWPIDPAHDANTIGVDTRPPRISDSGVDGAMYPLSSVAMHAYHEYQHTKNCGPGNRSDPTTGQQPNGDPPGDCAHAQMHLDAAQAALSNDPGNLSIAQCYAVAQALIAADHHIGQCQQGGGTPPDYTAVYNAWLEECR